MFEVFNSISDIVQDIIETGGYPGLIFVMVLENLFPPIPSELVLPFSGFLVADNRMTFLGVWVSTTIGSLLGAIMLYYVGVWAGDPLIRQFLQRYGRWFTISEADYDRVLNIFERHGGMIVFLGRLIPTVRSVVSIPAGAKRMPMPQFLLYTTAGSAVWNFILIMAGMQLGENWENVIGIVKQYQLAIFIIIGVVLAVVGIRGLMGVFNRFQAEAVD